MAIDINLVVENTNSSINQERIKKITSISFAVLFITALVSLMVFLIGIRFSAGNVRKQQDKVLSSLSPYDSTSSKLLLLTNRVTDISFLIKNRKNSNDLLGKIVADLPSSITITDLALKNNSLSISVSSNSLLDLNDFLNKFLLLSTRDKKITGVSLDSLSSTGSDFIMNIKAQVL